MDDVISKINELEFEKILWVIFIFISALNIYGDNLEELFLKYNDIQSEKISKTIFIFTIAISLLIYLYFVYRNYNNYQKDKSKNINTNLDLIRLAGSILIVIGVIFILYYEVNEKTPFGTPTI